MSPWMTAPFMTGYTRTTPSRLTPPTTRATPIKPYRTIDSSLAINSAISVDLTGQVNADSIGSRIYSGVGGQVDFIRAASISKDGRAIIAMPSTAPDGMISRLVPRLAEGAGVVTSRADVDTIITEHGVAELYGKSVGERIEALIAIADPRRTDQRGEKRTLLLTSHIG